MKPYYDHDGIVMYHGDCREILPHLPKVDLVLTDPPYGLNDKWGSWATKPGNGAGRGSGRLWGKTPAWDVAAPDAEIIDAAVSKGTHAIVWGGNYFKLPIRSSWLVWDKGADTIQSQAELAWSNLSIAVRVFSLTTLAAFGNGGRNGEYKEHPTQKPLPLILWCIGLSDSASILDPFMGAGTTLVAAKRLGRYATGIEIEEKYCEVAARRVEAQRLTLFESIPPEQLWFED